ncbi:MAG: hypothetical protein JXC31_05390 [Acholeplasmataceae bacterium]|nr:hypothetical protein [Acholeplasmataceae bacterium]
MDFFIQFVISYASYVIIAYFVYNILGRKRNIPMIILGVIFISSLIDFTNKLGIGLESKVLVLYFMMRVLPVLFAFYTFMVITGGVQFFSLKRRNKPLKGISSDIQTKRLSTMISMFSLVGSLGFGTLSFFYIEGFIKYMMIVILIFAFIFSIYILLSNHKILNEQVILIIGRNREKLYSYQIPKDKYRIVISDFFNNDNYIVDPIGIAILKDENRKIQKDYLYWIATSDSVDVSDEKLNELSKLNYSSQLSLFEKYHYRTLIFDIDSSGNANLLKNKKIK